MLVAAPGRWDEACFAVPAVRALVASGLHTGILCPEEQRGFWSTLEGVTVLGFPVRTKAKLVAAGISGNWQASLAWESGFAAEVFKIAGIPRRLGADERRLKKLLTHPLSFAAGPLEHRVRHYLAAVEQLGIGTGRPEFFAPATLGVAPVSGMVLLCPGSDFGPSHEWPVARWQEVAEALIHSGRQVTVASVNGGRGLGKILAEKMGGDAGIFQSRTAGRGSARVGGIRIGDRGGWLAPPSGGPRRGDVCHPLRAE